MGDGEDRPVGVTDPAQCGDGRVEVPPADVAFDVTRGAAPAPGWAAGAPLPSTTMSTSEPARPTPVDVKPRSRDVTDGKPKAAARAMLRAIGLTEDDWVKPQVGIANSWNEITPCNMTLRALADDVRAGIREAGGVALEFGTITVSDGISMGHEGMRGSLVSREVSCDSVETVVFAERLDGFVGMAGCDKSMPAMLMASARLDLASILVYNGSIMPGEYQGRALDITSVFEAVGANAAGTMSDEDLLEIERRACPGEGACGGMFTANTMSSISSSSSSLIVPAALAPTASNTLVMSRARPWYSPGMIEPL